MENKLTKKEIVKTLLVILSTILTSVVFYYIGHYFGYRAHLLVPSVIDNIIKQNNHYIYFYISWYPLLLLVPLMFGLKENLQFKKYIKSVYICLVLALITFITYPTIMERPELIINTFSDRILSFIHIFSSPTKCVPSLHVALATLFIISNITSKKMNTLYKVVIILISLGIIFSTMAVKQHYFIDVITGIAVAIISWLIAVRIKKI